ncbi:MAG: Ldh family oxidoreductase [Chloroflexi bacterium]|nr:Ldh family oxidoreductase [Chloroflexota bacterium]
MLERFKLKEQELVRVPESALRGIVVTIFEKMGVPPDDCRLAADVLVTADLRGVESHGVSNMLRGYVRAYQQGQTNPRPRWRIVRESPATASIDCDTGLGIIVAPKAMEIAIEKAKKVGMGMVTMRNGRHMGMASYHAMLALKHDMIGMCMTSTPPEMLPTFGAEPRLGTNPIALAAPADKEVPFVYDAATTVVAGNKLGLARRLGIKLPAGWVADASGSPIMVEADPPVPGYEGPGGSRMLPLGSTRDLGSHKGYGLAGVVEILSGILTGGGYGAKIGRPNFNHCVAAYNIESFMDTAQFKQTMDEWLQMLKSTKPAPGHNRVLYPGLPEAECEAENRAKGIPLHPEVVGWFRSICGQLSIPCPM